MKTLVASFFLAVLSCSATTVNCSIGIPSIESLNPTDGCVVGGLLNNQFVETHSPLFSAVNISILGDDVLSSGQGENLHFGIDTDPSLLGPHDSSAWIHLYYDVTGPNLNFAALSNLDGSGVVIFETVCKSSFFANFGECPIGDILATLAASPGQSSQANFTAGPQVFIRKELIYGDASITRFDNEVSGHAPEPGTYASFIGGISLIALGWKRRK